MRFTRIRLPGLCNRSRWFGSAAACLVGLVFSGCSSSGGSASVTGSSAGGAVASGGGVVGTGGYSGGVPSTGGATGTASVGGNSQGGSAISMGGGLTTGGTTAGGASGLVTGGSQSVGGASSIGGGNAGGTKASGGAKSNGGAATVGGTSVGGSGGKGGSGSGGIATGGIAMGGTATGGTATGGTAMGGTAMGGTATGGVAGDRCDLGLYDAAMPPKALTLSGNLGTHDPSAIESNGTYYLFATGLGAKTSTNLTNWAAAASPFAAPAWAVAAVPGVTDLWAADISYFGGKYHLYYSASTFGSNRSCIGQATRTALNSGGTWVDQGSPVVCSNVGTSDNWNAIDPAVVLDSAGTPWMALGSFWSGIKIIQLDQSGARVGTTVTAIASRPNNGGALEGAYIVRRCGYYYLFTSWDTCCKGASSTYNIRVGRSASVTGPYTDKAGTALLQGGGTLVAQTGGSWVGPGGQSVLVAGNKAYLIYHAYASSNGAATLRIADLVWDASGWPVPVGP